MSEDDDRYKDESSAEDEDPENDGDDSSTDSQSLHNYSSGSRSGSGYRHGIQVAGYQAEKRAHHNALERKRRDHIKDSFHGLRDCIPTLQGEKTSRAHILNKATEYIEHMQQKNYMHQRDIDNIKRTNTRLESQIRALDKNGDLTAQLDEALNDEDEEEVQEEPDGCADVNEAEDEEVEEDEEEEEDDEVKDEMLSGDESTPPHSNSLESGQSHVLHLGLGRSGLPASGHASSLQGLSLGAGTSGGKRRTSMVRGQPKKART